MRTIFVTGSTDGIGLQTARDLIRLGHQVIVHGRQPGRVEQTAADLGAFGAVAFDLSDRDAVHVGAAEVAKRFGQLDTVVHNAGIFATARQLDRHGVELSLAVNHLATALLTYHLLPTLRAAPADKRPARLVFVASVAHSRGTMHWPDLTLEHGFGSGYAAYAQSKLANVLFAAALSRRLDPALVTANSLHPGVVSTKLLRAGFDMNGPDSLAEGAATSVFLAQASQAAGMTGRYFARSKPTDPAPHARDTAEQERLFAWTCQELGLPTEGWGG